VVDEEGTKLCMSFIQVNGLSYKALKALIILLRLCCEWRPLGISVMQAGPCFRAGCRRTLPLTPLHLALLFIES